MIWVQLIGPWTPKRSEISLTNEVVTGPDRRVSILVARNSFPAGPGSSPAAVSRTASRMAVSSSLRPSIFAATAADLRARRSRQQPSYGGSARLRSSSNLRAIPAAKAASVLLVSRPRGRAQPGRRDDHSSGRLKGWARANPCARD